MTIDSTWLRAFKDTGPEAFTQARPFKTHCAFVDGQIKLMQGGFTQPQTWEEYIHRQFIKPLERMLQQCEVLVLAFDNYALVPSAKGMTQLKRRKHIPALPFTETSELPCMVPDGEKWTQCISNRTFKSRVIDLVILRLPMLLLKRNPGKRLIIDYTQPSTYALNESTGLMGCESLENLDPMGEADIKFTRYADMFGSLLVDSIDGDSIPIALLHHERCLRSPAATMPPKVCVYRLELKDPIPSSLSGTKRKKDEEADKKKSTRSYEYVNVQSLYYLLVEAISQGIGHARLPLHTGHEMGMLISLICLTGTDFSRNLPQVSGKTLFEFLPGIWMTLAMAYDPRIGQLREEDATDRLVSSIYHMKFQNHTKTRLGLATVLADLHASKLSTKTKSTLPDVSRVTCTVRNANWVLQYWRCDEGACPDPLQPIFGYAIGANGLPMYSHA